MDEEASIILGMPSPFVSATAKMHASSICWDNRAVSLPRTP
ncbi:MAG: hypothetical protein ACLU0O_03410 [Collinsella sp.]